MRSKHVGFLVLTVAVAALAAPALSEARSIPFFGKAVCKEDKERLGHEQRILRDRHRLAFDQCRAGVGGGKSRRCEDLQQQQKSEQKRFQDQRKRTLDDCKQRADDPKPVPKPGPKPVPKRK
jgi:hypothetical protein